LLNAAIDDGILVSNPAAKLDRTLKLTVSKTTRQEEIKALTKEQRQLFLATAWREGLRYYPPFFILAGTGMRLGEALALQSEDVDLHAKTIRIARGSPKMMNWIRRSPATGARWIYRNPWLTCWPRIT